MMNEKFITVNPGKTKDGKDFTIFDHRNRLIKRKEKGNKVLNCAFIRRRLKDKDMVLVIGKTEKTLAEYKEDRAKKANKANAPASNKEGSVNK